MASATLLLAFFFTTNASAFYNPIVGRWLNRDPIGEKGGINLVGFVANNPVTGVDYLGHFLGWGYGRYCGFSRNGPGAPIDEVDAACALHDSCIPTFKSACIPGRIKSCNLIFCGLVAAADCSTSPDPTKCQNAKRDILLACILAVGVP